jgi:NodT family efflux transporter outer membrane factor (OMF) lipoprotein
MDSRMEGQGHISTDRKMNRVHIVILALAPWVASCALGPKVMTPDTHTPAAFEAPTDVTAGLGAGAIDAWWTLYNDPQLNSLITEALANAPDALSAEARLREAAAIRSEALDAFNPQGNLQGNGSYTHTYSLGRGPTFPIPGTGQSISLAPNGANYSAGIQFPVSWEVDLFGRRRTTRHRADADFAAARFNYEAARASLAANVADQLFLARGLAIQLDDSRETERIQAQLATIARKKADHGLGSNADADQAEAEAAQATAIRTDVEAQLHVARRELLVLIGRGVDPLASLPTPADIGGPPAVPTSVPGELMARRPDVREAAERLKSAAHQLKLNELALFPKFILEPGVGLNTNNQIGFPITSDFWSIGLNMVQPVLDMPRLKSEINAQGARADEAAIAYQKTVQTAYGEAENALVQLSSDVTRVRVLTDGEAKARRAFNAARLGYSAGVNDLTATISAERTWRTARTTLTTAQVQAMRQSVQAFKALGGGWPSETAMAARAAG